MKAFSTGGQKSVHECWLTPAELASLRRELAALLDRREDSLVLIPPEPRAAVRTLGLGTAPRDPRFVFVG